MYENGQMYTWDELGNLVEVVEAVQVQTLPEQTVFVEGPMTNDGIRALSSQESDFWSRVDWEIVDNTIRRGVNGVTWEIVDGTNWREFIEATNWREIIEATWESDIHVDTELYNLKERLLDFYHWLKQEGREIERENPDAVKCVGTVISKMEKDFPELLSKPTKRYQTTEYLGRDPIAYNKVTDFENLVAYGGSTVEHFRVHG
jgi:hypothetical protein